MKLKRASLVTKLVILVLFCYMTISLLSLQNDIAVFQTERDELENQVTALTIGNSTLRADIANQDDPAYQENIARDKLGLVLPGEKIFIDITN